MTFCIDVSSDVLGLSRVSSPFVIYCNLYERNNADRCHVFLQNVHCGAEGSVENNTGKQQQPCSLKHREHGTYSKKDSYEFNLLSLPIEHPWSIWTEALQKILDTLKESSSSRTATESKERVSSIGRHAILERAMES